MKMLKIVVQVLLKFFHAYLVLKFLDLNKWIEFKHISQKETEVLKLAILKHLNILISRPIELNVIP